MMSHGRIEILPATFAEWLLLLITQFLIEAAQESLVVDTHGFEEAQLELLTITAKLRCQSISLALEFLLGNIEQANIIKCLLALDDLDVAVLVVSNQTVNLNLVLGDHGHHFVALSFAFAPIALVFKWYINCIVVFRI